MSRWSVFWAGLKGFFTPRSSVFLSIAQLALGSVNALLAKPVTAARLATAYAVAKAALDVLDKYADWCPAKWRAEFDALREVVRDVVEVFADGEIDLAEVQTVIEKFRAAYAKWNED